MTSKHRTLLAIALFVPLAAVLLVTFACVPVPVGDPAKSKVPDERPNPDAFLAVPKDAKPEDKNLTLIRPWDEHTYFLQYISVSKKDDKEDVNVENYKAWLTPLAGATFLTCEPMDDTAYEGHTAKKPKFWAVFRIEFAADGLEAKIINADSDLLKDLMEKAKDGKATREDLETIIKAHADDKVLYGDTVKYKKLGKDDGTVIDEIVKKANLGLQSN